MNKATVQAISNPSSTSSPVMLTAEPEQLEIDLQRMAIMVIDMQNTFVCKGGLFDHIGFDVTAFHDTVKTIDGINSAAREKGIKVIYIVHRNSPDLRETGGPDSAYWHKLKGPLAVDDVRVADNFVIRGTWGAEIIDELTPREGDIIVEKPKFSAFYGTDLDTVLKTFNIKYIAFVGTSTNICVEASLRDALNLGYFCILVSDATVANPPAMQEATMTNVKLVYGWVATSENLIKAINSKTE